MPSGLVARFQGLTSTLDAAQSTVPWFQALTQLFAETVVMWFSDTSSHPLTTNAPPTKARAAMIDRVARILRASASLRVHSTWVDERRPKTGYPSNAQDAWTTT